MAEVNSPLGMDDEEFLKQDLSQLEAELMAAEEAEAQEETEEIEENDEMFFSESVNKHSAELHKKYVRLRGKISAKKSN